MISERSWFVSLHFALFRSHYDGAQADPSSTGSYGPVFAMYVLPRARVNLQIKLCEILHISACSIVGVFFPGSARFGPCGVCVWPWNVQYFVTEFGGAKYFLVSPLHEVWKAVSAFVWFISSVAVKCEYITVGWNSFSPVVAGTRYGSLNESRWKYVTCRFD